METFIIRLFACELLEREREVSGALHLQEEVRLSLRRTLKGGKIIIFKSCTSGGGLDELPSDDMLAPSRPVVNPSISHSDVSESLSREVVLGGDR
jgi:hypothetical protein